MITALLRAFVVLSLSPMRRVVALSLALAVGSFIVLWLGVAFTLSHHSWFDWRPLDWLIDALGAIAVLALSWLLFPAAVTLIMGFFLNEVAGTVESLNYPGRGPARQQPLRETVGITLRLMGFSVFLNLLVLPVYLLVPVINLFVFLALNGYLFGREYFEVVALRRLDRAATRAVRRRFAVRIFLGGVMIAALFAVPFVNLVAPVVGTAFMVHLVEYLRRLRAPALAF